MSTKVPRPASLCLERRPEAFDQIPAHIQRRDDLTSGAKRLYGLLTSVGRMRAQPDYRWLAAELAASVRSIVRWVRQLAAAGLIAVRRRGQGLTNLFVVLALGTSGGAVPHTAQTTARRDPARAGTYGQVKNNENRKNRSTGSKDFDARNYYETREGFLISPT